MGLLTMEGGLYALLSDDADFDNIVHLTKTKKLAFMTKLGSKSKNPDRVCSNALNKLRDKNLIASVGVSVYMLNPQYRDKQNSSTSNGKLMAKFNGYREKRHSPDDNLSPVE
ncbi:hypothetical protein [Thiothrix subterranea]|uniref:Plasmid replication protein RepL domain-containing protein n=1 Tax=Thiothrix subterranea TaxID=2735563 RepID=A0AA51MK99_9GAMM|nr:hypothetical protein [Thiothrix subterranea]MDQ5771028.1 hypothetical protein [Thiothrix subterranea]WML85977.1 hypothetical protein RCG00_16955 [Thiothrix subterranea]